MTSKASFHLHPTRVRSFRWRSLALPSNRGTLAISANILLFSCRVPLVARCLVASIFQAQNLVSPRHGVWVPNDAALLIATGMEPARRLGFEAEGKASPSSILLHKYVLNVWVPLFPLASAAVPLEVLPEELS